MDVAGLIVNIGIFVASAVAAFVAWWQAIEAGRRRDAAEKASKKAEEARGKAVTAQESAAASLKEANEIAQKAAEVTAASEARKTERHLVRWEPMWDSQGVKWTLANRGPDDAFNVRVIIEGAPMGRMIEEHERLGVDRGLVFDLSDHLQRGEYPLLRWHVEWQTPLGTARSESGRS